MNIVIISTIGSINKFKLICISEKVKTLINLSLNCIYANYVTGLVTQYSSNAIVNF